MRRSLVFATLGLAGAVTAGVGVYLAHDWLPTGRALSGSVVAEGIPPASEPLGEWLERQRQRFAEREAYLQTPDELIKMSYAELGIELDVADTLRSTLEHAQHGSLLARLSRARRARAGLEKVPASWRFDRSRAEATLRALVPRLKRDPIEARLDLEEHRRVQDEPGRELEMESSLARLAKAPRETTLVVELAFRRIPAEVTLDMISTIDVSKVLGSYESDFARKARSRITNIRVAAEYLNGTVIAPNQVVSFNKVVGPRTEQRGFIEAPVIVNDEMERGLGGGVCQVASTLHAAAVYGDLDIVSRRSHSRPSGYMPLGLDAVVVEDEVDLRIRNPYDTALMIHAFLPHPTRIRVEFLGKNSPSKVEHNYEVKEKLDFYRRVRTSSEVNDNFDQRQKGIFGYDIRSVVRITYADGSRKVKTYDSKYYPVPEVYWVAPGYDPASLPALPDGARHIEIDGVAYGADGAELERAPSEEGTSNAAWDETQN